MDNFSAESKPEKGKPRVDSLGLEWQPWAQSFYQNLKDAIAPPKLAPLRVTSRPVQVPSIWSHDAAFGPSQAVALAVHVGLIALLMFPLYQTIAHPPNAVTQLGGRLGEISPFRWRLPAGDGQPHGGGGGGDRDPIPPSAGRPPAFAFVQLTPPTVTVRNQNPALAVEPTVVGNPELRIADSNLLNLGDPQETTITDSNGPGTGGGIGTNHGSGIGNGNGPGLGPGEDGDTGGGVHIAGVYGYGTPSCLYCPDPKYSEAARQVKYMGTVLVQLTVGADGRPSNIVVLKDPGMGLGEKALEAVKTWQFKPALGPDRNPAATRVNIEVQFRLL